MFRRSLISHSALIIASLAGTNPSGAAAGDITIGVVAPFTGSFELLASQIKAGSRAYAISEGGVSVVYADDRCEAEGGAEAAQTFVARQVSVATGFLCTEAIEAAMPILAKAGIPIITTGVRTDRLRKKASELPPVFRLPERSGDEARAVAEILTERWRGELFGIVDDGTIYARELAEAFRLAAETAGLKPAYVDTFRPQLENQIGLAGRLKKAGVTHLFAAGDRPDIAIIARDAAAIGHTLKVAGGEALLAADGDVPLPEGVLAIAPLDVVNARTISPLDMTLETSGYWVPQYAAMEIAAAATRQAQSSGRAIRDILVTGTFETVMGPVDFDDEGINQAARFGLYHYDGEKFVE